MSVERDLMMSKTLERLFQLSQNMPGDIRNPEDLKSAFATCSVDLVIALDNDRIHFDNGEDKAVFYGLLAVVVDYCMNGQLKHAFKKATLN